jgi:hypothetical protein
MDRPDKPGDDDFGWFFRLGDTGQEHYFRQRTE